MANLSEGAWRRSIRPVAALGRAAVAAVGPPLRSSWRAVGDHARAALARHLDGGFGAQAVAPRAARGIEVENLAVAYGERIALADVTGSFPPASLTAVVGPNGGGKSSLLKTLAGVVSPRSGTIVGARSGQDLAYLPQQAEIERSFPITVGELVALGGWRSFGAFRAPPDGLVDRIGEATRAVGLEGSTGRPIAELSAGQLQRALFGRLLLQDAAVILLDEPFAAIDEQTTDDLLQLVRRWHEQGRTVVAVLHDLDQVRTHFPTTLLLARAAIGWGDTGSVLTPENLARARRAVERPGEDRGPAA